MLALCGENRFAKIGATPLRGIDLTKLTPLVNRPAKPQIVSQAEQKDPRNDETP